MVLMCCFAAAIYASETAEGWSTYRGDASLKEVEAGDVTIAAGESLQPSSAGADAPGKTAPVKVEGNGSRLIEADFSLPYLQNFNSGTLTSLLWTCSRFALISNAGVGGTGGLRANLGAFTGNTGTAISPAFDNVTAGTVVRFSKRFVNFGGATAYNITALDTIYIQVRKAVGDDWGDWTTIHQIDSSNHTSSTQYSTAETPPLGEAFAGETIQIRYYVRVNVVGMLDIFVDLDDFMCLEEVDYDLSALSITGPTTPLTGTPTVYTIAVRNEGLLPATGWAVQLMQVGSPDAVLGSIAGTPLAVGETTTVEIIHSFATEGTFQIYGLIDWTADMQPANDRTDNITVNVESGGETLVEIGTGTENSYMIPIFYQYCHSLAQTIYQSSQINTVGDITQISYYFTRAPSNYPPATGAPVVFYLANIPDTITEFTSSTAWINVNEFTEVWSGSLQLEEPGSYWVDIPLAQPFTYTGGNLAVMAYRPWEPDYYSSSNRFMATPAGGNVSLYWRHDNAAQEVIPSAQPNGVISQAGLTYAYFSNIKLYMGSSGMGLLNGTATEAGAPLSGVTISIDGTTRTATTNAAGQYNLPYLLPGTYQITAGKHLYTDYHSPDILITVGEITTHDFSLSQSASVSVSGTLRLYDDPSTAAAGAVVSLTGYADYTDIIADVEGNFVISDVITAQDYELRVRYDGYTTYRADVSVAYEDIDLGEILLTERAYVVKNVVAVNNTPANATITWDEPGIGEDIWFSHSSDVYQGTVGMGAGGWYETANRFDAAQLNALGVAGATLTEFAFFAPAAAQIPPAGYEARIYAGGTGLTNPGPLASSQPIPAGTVLPVSWNIITLLTPVLIPEDAELYLVLYSDHLGGTQPHPYCAGALTQSYGNIRRYAGADFSPSSFSGNYMIKGMATGAEGPRVLSSSAIAVSQPFYPPAEAFTTTTIHQSTTAIDIADTRAITLPSPSTINPFEVYKNTRKTRVRTGYDIYITSLENMQDEELWIELATDHATTTYVDTDWPEYENPAAYRYAVKAVYTGDIRSAARFSNIIDIGMTVPVSFTVTAANGLPVNSGELVLRNADGDPTHIYTLTSDTNVYTHTNIWRGTYSLVLSHHEYEVSLSDYLIDDEPTTATLIATPLIYAGDPSSNIGHGSIPIAFTYRNSISQSLYTDAELPLPGTIHQLTYTMALSGPPITNPIRIYMANTTQSSLNTWLGLSQFTLVYSGTYSTITTPSGYVNIPLDTPFVYTGGNLVIMAIRQYSTPYNNSLWQVTQMPGFTRSRYNAGDTEINFQLEANWGEGFSQEIIPNVSFGMAVGDYGLLKGTVTSAGNPLPDARITLNASTRYVMSDSDGHYTLNFVAPGTRGISASKHAYIDYTYSNIPVINGSIATHDFAMSPLPTVTVSGLILASDTAAGLAGCEISLTGYADYTGYTTDINGTFLIPGVFANRSYTLTVLKEGYIPFVNSEVFVLGTDLVLPSITLLEKAFKPRNVTATPSGGNVNVAWEVPAAGDQYWFGLSNENALNTGIGTGGAVQFSIAHRYTPAMLNQYGIAGATLSAVSFVPWALTCTWTVQIWTGGTGYPRDLGDPVYSQAIDSATLSPQVWNEVQLNIPFVIPSEEEFVLGFALNVASGYAAAVDAGPQLHNYADLMLYNGTWQTMGDLSSTFVFNWHIQGFVEDGLGTTRSFALPNITPNEAQTLAVNAPTKRAEKSLFTIDTAPSPRSFGQKARLTQPDVPEILSRQLTGYNVYKATQANMHNPASWTTLAEGITNTAYTHQNGMTDGSGLFVYIVRAVYTNSNLSDPAYSPVIVIGGTDITLIVSGQNGASTAGAIVHLTHNSIPDFDYEQIVDGTGMVFFQSVPSNATYTLNITADHLGFFDYLDTAFITTGEVMIVPITLLLVNSEEDTLDLPKITALLPNYPNPFNPTTIIPFDKAKDGWVKIEVYNLKGQKIATLADKSYLAGSHTVEWEGKDSGGSAVSSGVYFYKLTTDEATTVRKMMLVK